MALLIGPENTTDYEIFAELKDDGFRVFKRYAHARQAVHAIILWDLMNGQTREGYEMLVDGRCLICNQPLTCPESVTSGIGPVCRKRIESHA